MSKRTPHLRIESARNLLAAERAWSAANYQLALADKERRKWRARCRPLLPLSERVFVGDIEITVTPAKTGPTFKLGAFLKEHRITRLMRPFVTAAVPYERWTVKGPEAS